MTHEGYDGVVYDLDGTLVRLVVDWDGVREEVAALFRSAGREPGGDSLWALLERAAGEADREGPSSGDADDTATDETLGTRVSETIAAREREGARRSDRLPAADELLSVATDGPVAVVSLNAESACRVALAEHGLADAVATVVGRDSVPERKPHPAPLLTALQTIGVRPERALYVGDSERDHECARRAGVDFEYVSDGPSGY